MTQRTIKAGADAQKRRVMALVADGMLSANEALLLLREKQESSAFSSSEVNRSSKSLAIAIVGMSSRFGKAEGLDEYWNVLRDGRSIICDPPYDRFNNTIDGERPRASFLNDPEAFDNGFFKISPTEAALMDPQQRIFLEQSYHALEDAGLGGDSMSEARCGVYVGAGSGDYSGILKARGISGNPLALMGNVASILAARISYFLNLKGPSIAVDTACSSSLTALYLAVEALEAKTVDVALAGGVCVINTTEFMAAMKEGGMLSPTSACHTFDASADGFVCGEGAGVVVLKRLSSALADGDTIHGVIRGIGINQDGRTNGITAPSGTAQQALEEEVYRRFDIDPRLISYVETHGTGTPLGDPIEVDALTEAFRSFTQDRGFCRIGSVKTNIGHTLTAAGLAGLIKILLMMRYHVIPPTINFNTPNPKIDFNSSPFMVATALQSWDVPINHSRIAALSSFGFSGTNVHLVIEEFPLESRLVSSGIAAPILLSAKNQALLAVYANQLLDWVMVNSRVSPSDVGLSLGVGRGAFHARAGFLARTREELISGLSAIVEGKQNFSDDATVNAFVKNGTLASRSAFDLHARRVSIPGYPFARIRPGELASSATTISSDAEAALKRHGSAFGLAEAWGREALISVLADMGLFSTGRTTFTRAWSRHKLGIVDNRARLFDALVNIAARQKVVALEGNLIRPSPSLDPIDRVKSQSILRSSHPDTAPFLDLLDATLEGLPLVLTGRRTATEVLFPGGKGDLVEAIYSGNPLAKELNLRLAQRLTDLAVKNNRPLKLLEVGGGTGSATRAALDALSTVGRFGKYVFTDVASAFIKAAPASLAPIPKEVKFLAHVFDLEAEVPASVATQCPFDVIIASNVLHATKRIDTTLKRLHGLLLPAGSLLLNEVVNVQDFATLTFGLTDGWWAFEDANIRLPDAPVLSIEGWRRVLKSTDFPDVSFNSITDRDGHPVQSIICARRGEAASNLPIVSAYTTDRRDDANVQIAYKDIPAQVTNSSTLDSYLRGVVAQVLTLPVEEIDSHGRFMELGLDSILGVALVERINTDLAVDLRPTVVFDYPTIADLAGHLSVSGVSLSQGLTNHRESKEVSTLNALGSRDEAIAVIGLSARFADASNINEFRKMLRDGRSGIVEVPLSRWSPEVDNIGAVNPFERWGGFLANAEGFDPLVMRMSGKEAELTDPQHRVFLMEAWRALEDAGYGDVALNGLRCGVFVGAHGGDYTHRMTLAGVEPESFAFMGNAASILAARISYMLNLKGPALAIDTACSSSLVAIHTACRSIQDGDCDIALAGGVFVTTVKGFNVAAGKAGMLSPNGRCAAFDVSADGFVPGEGGGAVLLKPLSRALEDGDNIQAVVLGSGINQDGKTNGITAPSPESQAALHRLVYSRYSINPTSIGYVEAHGTGTSLGDPIEVEGLTRAWADWTDRRGSCAIGSVKTNIGHAAHAAGIGGFIKAVLAVRDGEIYPSLHYNEENPRLNLSKTPFRVPTVLESWQVENGAKRRAAVSSFGFSGTNCHIVIEERPDSLQKEPVTGQQLFLLSAKTLTALATKRRELAEYLENRTLALADVALTLAMGRTHFEHRFAAIADSTVELVAALRCDNIVSKSNTILDDMARLYRDGCEISLSNIGLGGARISLPTYPFELTPYWIDVPDNKLASNKSQVPQVTIMAADWVSDPTPVTPVSGQLLIVGEDPVVDEIAAGWIFGNSKRFSFQQNELLYSAANQSDAVVIVGSREPNNPFLAEDIGAALLSVVQGVLSNSGRSVPVLLVHRGAPGESAFISFGQSIDFLGGRAQVRAFEMEVFEVGRILSEIGFGPREVRIVAGCREMRQMKPILLETEIFSLNPYGAAVLITGGGGVLARLLALKLTRETGAKIVLLGRSMQTDAIGQTIRDIEVAGGVACYRVCDVADELALAKTISEIEDTFASICAVYHLAGVASEGSVISKTWSDMRVVFSPKALGLAALDNVLGDRSLQAFVVFTSLAAELGDFGQCDYALANAYADRFITWRDLQVRNGCRHGVSRAFGWPLWADGRLVMSSTGSQLFTEVSGLRAINTDEAFIVFDRVLSGREPSVMIVPSDAVSARRLMDARINHVTSSETSTIIANKSSDMDDYSTSAVAATLTRLIAEQMKLPADRLMLESNLVDFGFDSIALKDFAVSVSRTFGIDLSPAVFFAHGSISALATYLTKEHGIGAKTPALPVEANSSKWPGAQSKFSSCATHTNNDAIAIIGMSGRFPGSPNVSAFWRNLEAGCDLIGSMPEERRDWGLEQEGGIGGYIDCVDRFEYDFFGLSLRDSLLMDPQHRLAIEASWNAVEAAGVRMDTLAGRRIGVLFASQVNEYARLVPFDESSRAQMALGNVSALLSNRISWLFDLRGPSEAIDTACSGSLVAVHRAVQILRANEAEMVLAGGVSVMLSSDSEETVRKLGVASPDSRCFVFDSRANGYVKGEGVGAVLLKPLKNALADGNPVLAVIRGSAVTHGGHAQTITAPNASAQAETIVQAVRNANIHVDAISYIEAHGTGTELGDPVEVEGLRQAFRNLGRSHDSAACPIGSVKSNIGHLEPAAGIAGLVKLIQALRHHTIPASLHVENINPLIDLSDDLVRIANRVEPWVKRPNGGPRCAGVSSFGFGGTNAHLVLEEAPKPIIASLLERSTLLVVSATTKQRLIAYCEILVNYLIERSLPLINVVATLMMGRVPLAARVAVLVTPGDNAIVRLNAAIDVLKGTANDASVVEGLVGTGALKKGQETGVMIRELLEEGELIRIARLWVAGTEIDWQDIGLASGPRITLPERPLHGSRCWFKGKLDKGEVDAPKLQSTSVDALVKESSKESSLVSSSSSINTVIPTASQHDQSEVADRITDLVASALYVEAGTIDRTAGLSDIGLDSILAVELVQEINQTFGTKLQAARLYDYPTVEALAKFVASSTRLDQLDNSSPTPIINQSTPPASDVPQNADAVLLEIRRIVAEALYVEPEVLDETSGFGDLGLDSILAVEVVQNINDCYGISLQAARLYDHPTIMDLANYVTSSLSNRLTVPIVDSSSPLELSEEATSILNFLRERIGITIGTSGNSIDPSAPITDFRIDPESAGKIIDDIALKIGFRPTFEQISRCTDLRSLAAFLASGNNSQPIDLVSNSSVSETEELETSTNIDYPQKNEFQTNDKIVFIVRSIVAEVLGVESNALSLDVPLKELGIDLVQAGEIAYRLNRYFGTDMTSHRLMTFRGIIDIASAFNSGPDNDPGGNGFSPSKSFDSTVQSAEIINAVPSNLTINSTHSLASEAVAIIGIAARYPRAASVNDFWNLICDGRSGISEVPADRWSVKDNIDTLTDPSQRSAVHWGGFISDVDRFDPLFFGLSPKEAEVMDPQQRLFLEEGWHAFEDAGLSRESIKGMACGIFVGGGQSDYVHLLPRDGVELSGQMLLGNTSSVLAGRLAYFLDLKGPSLAIDTACSSGLVATHYAVRSLLDGECQIALAGGVNLMLTPQMHLMTAASGMLAPDGRCKTFDNTADGFVPGEGLGVVVLKPLTKAIADCDRIYATILGSAVNQDGRTSSITAPSAASQARLEAGLYLRAGIDVQRIGLVEAHGTGTKLGDPIEVSALTQAFTESGVPLGKRESVAIGSVKTNIGHTLAASGMAGLIKVALSLRYGKIPPSLNFSQPNTHISFEDTPFRVPTTLQAMDPDRPLAAVSSFGFSGTNAHMVLGPPPKISIPFVLTSVLVFPLSAPSQIALRRLAATLADSITPDAILVDVAYTLALRRTLFNSRCVVVAASRSSLLESLRLISTEKVNFDTAVGPQVPDSLIDDVKLFLSGGKPSWQSLPRGKVADLPGYPFDRRRFWVEPTTVSAKPITSLVLSSNHPILVGHLVAGRRILPGVTALVAVCRGQDDWVMVSDLIWHFPAEAKDTGLDINLVDCADGSFSMLSGAVTGTRTIGISPETGSLSMPLGGNTIESPQIYDFLKDAGIVYGPEFHRVASVRVIADEALVTFTLSTKTLGDEIIDIAAVGILDAALHALAAFAIDRGDPGMLLMPSSLKSAYICSNVACATKARLSLCQGSQVGTIIANIELFASNDMLVAKLSGLCAKASESSVEIAKTFLLQRHWVAESSRLIPLQGSVAILIAAGGSIALSWAKDLINEVNLLEQKAYILNVSNWKHDIDKARTVVFVAFSDSCPPKLEDAELYGVHLLLEVSRFLIASGVNRSLRVVTRGVHSLADDEYQEYSFAALSGFVRTLAREHPALDPLVIDLPLVHQENVASGRAHQRLLLADGGGELNDIAYRDGQRFVSRLSELRFEGEADLHLDKGSVVLILGGAGGIGQAISFDLARRYSARIVWIGRRAENDNIRAAKDKVKAVGGIVWYFQVNANDSFALTNIMEVVESKWGRIVGVIHAAIVLSDTLVETMDAETLDRALGAKSHTAVALEQALAKRQPDWLAIFSSSNALTCNPGQANYAAGCTFIDAWALSWGRRKGVRISVINWGFWGETGIVARDDYRARAIAAGVDPISTEEGLAIFRWLLSRGVRMAAVMRFAVAGLSQVEADVTRVLFAPKLPAIPEKLGMSVLASLSNWPKLDEARLSIAVADILAIEEYGRLKLMYIFGKMGVLQEKNQKLEDIVTRLGVYSEYNRLLIALFDIMARSGVLIMRDSLLTLELNPNMKTPEPPKVVLLSAHLKLLDTCLDGLTAVLTGLRKATDVLFPGGSASLVEAVYRDNPSSDPYNAMLAAATLSMAIPGRLLKVIEVGAGTGGATVAITDALSASGQDFDYTMTDVSSVFLDPARVLFSDKPQISFSVLDIDADPAKQGFVCGAYDLVIASNVLHTTSDLCRAVDHAKALLAPGGILLLNEMTVRSDLATLTFGLTDGWWAYKDSAARMPYAGPLLDVSGWRGLLTRAGFVSSAVGELGEQSGQSIIAAVSNGWIPSYRLKSKSTSNAYSTPAVNLVDSGLINWLRDIFSKALKLNPSELAVDEPYESYGVDSLVAMDIRSKIENKIGAFPTSLLFEGVTLSGFAKVLAREKPLEIAANFTDDKFASNNFEVITNTSRSAIYKTSLSNLDAARPSVNITSAADSLVLPSSSNIINLEPIAIVGMAGRYPKGESEAAFWNTLTAGECVACAIPTERWPHFAAPEPAARNAAMIEEVDRFDPLFFQISPAEAAAMDPQERIFLETVWAAIENAGSTPAQLGGNLRRVGVYAGAMRTDYQRIGTLDLASGGSGLAGSSFWSIANRVSHQLDFRGPSIAVDTACSAGLHAILLAIDALRNGVIDAAVAGGVHLILHPQNQRAMAAMGLLSPNGIPRPFDARADGFVDGDGVGAVILKRLSDAERDRDRVRAIILGGASGSNGLSTGYMLPSPDAMAELINVALNNAKVAPDAISYIEAQASGSPIGDPAEASALSMVYSAASGLRRLGTLKGVIGHLSAASGLAQLSKVVLQLEQEKILPFALPVQQHPDVELTKFVFSDTVTPWVRGDNPRIATITASGAGGSSAVLVVAEAPLIEKVSPQVCSVAQVFPLSAKKPEQLQEMAERLANYLDKDRSLLSAVAWTLQVGREAMAFRLAVIAEDRETLVQQLRAFLSGIACKSVAQGKANSRSPATPDISASAEDFAKAWVQGAPIDWRSYWQGAVPIPVSLPTYPFERRRCWIEEIVSSKSTPFFTKKDVCDSNAKTYQAVRIYRPSDVDNIIVEQVTRAVPLPDEVAICVETFSLNFGDLLSLRGSYPNLPPYPFTPGMEVVGRIIAVGAKVKGRNIGDRVAAITGGRGGHAEYVTLPASLTALIPDGLDPVYAVALPIAYLTGRYALNRADLASGETLLVTSAAGGVGTVLVQLAKAMGANVLATVGSSTKIAAIEALGAVVIDYSTTTDIVAWVLERTSGTGADVVINLLGGSAIQEGINSLAPGGRYVEIALSGLMASGRVDLSRLMDNQSIITVNLGRVMATPQRTAVAMDDLAQVLANNKLTPLVDSVYRFEHIADAYRRMASRKTIGRIVVAVDSTIPDCAPKVSLTMPSKSTTLSLSLTQSSVDNKLIDSIRFLVSAVLGLNPKEIDDERPLYELGMNSVSGLEIARRLEGLVSKPVAVTTLWQHCTISALAIALGTSNDSDCNDVARLMRTRVSPRSPLVAIREVGMGTLQSIPPLFFVHGAPGEVSWAVNLGGRLATEIPVYAFEAPGLHGDQPVPTMIEDFATIYADLLEEVCPIGQYNLGGYSGGGAIAFEVARILAERDHPATSLILLDANAPGTDSLRGMDMSFGGGFIYRLAANWLSSIWGGVKMLELEALTDTNKEFWADIVLNHLFSTSSPPMKREELHAMIKGMDVVASTIGKALAAYNTAPINPALKTMLIRCEQGMASKDNPLGLPAFLTDGDYRVGWDKLVGGVLKIFAVDCDHFSLVLEPNIKQVVEAIHSFLCVTPQKKITRAHVVDVVLNNIRKNLVDVPSEEIIPEVSMTDLGATSLDRVEVTLAAMEELGLDIPPRDLVGLANINALIDILFKHLNAASAY
ncbi:ptzD [Candidatus Endolissoclinum faulkneri L5]|uniref:PtzD n=1 Tax=Candidatus Endolissoclinum faulkneri L5 TaxID=1401328 RepID=V9TXE0_9PROT|nr:SDR family NAD(P)-dependent oxidoreductase [Candidatus Endolissoclinum faulkneri]AHC73995.1 ptzD [Candidatus Endolissoclinum faulkneri L5]